MCALPCPILGKPASAQARRFRKFRGYNDIRQIFHKEYMH